MAVRQHVVLWQHHWTSETQLLTRDRDRPGICRVQLTPASREPLGFPIKSFHLSKTKQTPSHPQFVIWKNVTKMEKRPPLGVGVGDTGGKHRPSGSLE